MTTRTARLDWWGYRHLSGTYQAKRYTEPRDIEEANASPFVLHACGPFKAWDREEALITVKTLTDVMMIEEVKAKEL